MTCIDVCHIGRLSFDKENKADLLCPLLWFWIEASHFTNGNFSVHSYYSKSPNPSTLMRPFECFRQKLFAVPYSSQLVFVQFERNPLIDFRFLLLPATSFDICSCCSIQSDNIACCSVLFLAYIHCFPFITYYFHSVISNVIDRKISDC